MAFSIVEWVDDNLQSAKPSKGGSEWTAECPLCGKYGGFYVNAESGKWVCFKCRDDGGQGSNIYSLIARVEGITYSQARARALHGIQFQRRKLNRTTLRDKVLALRGIEEDDEVEAGPVAAALPVETVPVYDAKRPKPWKLPKYLRARGIKKATAKAWNLGFIPRMAWYPHRDADARVRVGHRLIIPVVCPAGVSWTARDMTGDQIPKYMNPPDADHRKLLLGWPLVRLDGDVVLVEGPLDAIKLWQHGLPALALMGKVLSREQLGLLTRFDRRVTVTVMLDPEEQVAPIQVASALAVRFTNVFIAKLPDGIDPGKSTRSQALRAYDQSQRFVEGRVSMLKAKMAGITVT